MLRCSNCDSLLSERDVVSIVLDGKPYEVCPECLRAFLEDMEGTIEEVSPEEERYIRDEWDADERYDEMALRGAV